MFFLLLVWVCFVDVDFGCGEYVVLLCDCGIECVDECLEIVLVVGWYFVLCGLCEVCVVFVVIV